MYYKKIYSYINPKSDVSYNLGLEWILDIINDRVGEFEFNYQ